MFKIQSEENKIINWPVKVEIAVDGGATQKYEFTGLFKLQTDDERDAFELEAQKAAKAQAEQEAGDQDVTVLASAWKDGMIDRILQVMTGWKGVVGNDDQPLEFNRDNLRAAARGTRGTSVLRAINVAVSQINAGAKAKN
jgi:hypothetical protein